MHFSGAGGVLSPSPILNRLLKENARVSGPGFLYMRTKNLTHDVE